ncbi:alanine racemase [Acetobacter estunensis NRIC 0472]|uniref:Alanine racemase n=1 Tax=Acetobacter estunensis TaxID=104097 RepID=A0A967B6V7_9PROT|nr:alanine racemase [Acetobacter estunensis]NHO54957.1 alanine racemase [Acetobacter estunensis]GBQ25360.1 alanine racemase [Acetobacter estunensis NRIC 0472]
MGVNAQAAGGILTIDLGAVAENYRTLAGMMAESATVEHPAPLCAAAVKADAYGLGVEHVGPVLEKAGCRHFFVAHLSEGVALRPYLSPEMNIFVLHGPPPGTAAEFLAHDLIPVLNSMEQVAQWQALARRQERTLPAVLQVDSGMARFGFTAQEVDRLARDATLLEGIRTVLVMSHLACADTPENPANRHQLETFRALAAKLPAAPRSLAASSGLFLGPDWRFDLGRPGAALYGVNPTPGGPNPMQDVIRLQANVIQTRDVPVGQAVGYGGMFVAKRPTRVALLGVGYGDGFLRSASGRGTAILPLRPEVKLPLIGRVSMDSLAVDVTDLGEMPLAAGEAFDLIGPHNPLEMAAEAAGTIGYELLVDLGGRYLREWR